MADESQLSSLKQGIKAWNEWRRGHQWDRVDLRGAILSTANLQKANLSEADLSDANLNSTNLNEADLSEADLSRADLGGGILNQCRFE
jgi:uncharacterized protein YjbI with pentapeptide repeats